jgi:hypothetical protein
MMLVSTGSAPRRHSGGSPAAGESGTPGAGDSRGDSRGARGRRERGHGREARVVCWGAVAARERGEGVSVAPCG